MLRTIIGQISQELKKCGVFPVYTAFDNIPAEKKGRGIYTVVAVDSFESTTPIYSAYYLYLPFKAEAEITLAAGENTTAAQLYEYFDEKLLPITENSDSFKCSLRGLTVKRDSNIGRLVLKVRLAVSGICRLERSSV